MGAQAETTWRESPSESAARAAHRSFLDRYYGATHRIYDATRAPYLLGRDVLIGQLVRERWKTLVEAGCGTGRNLARLERRRPARRYGGIEPSAPMRERAIRRAPFARIVDGFAEDAPYGALVRGPVDRILFSYALSMITDPDEAIAHARLCLSPRGDVACVDFGDLGGVPRPLRRAFVRFLDAFHVRPLPRALFVRHGARIVDGPLGYYRIARFPPLHVPAGYGPPE